MPSFCALLVAAAASSASAATIIGRTADTTAAPAPVCNLPGYGAGPGSSGNYYRYLGNTNIAACQELCHRDDKCHSFSSYTPGGSGNCYLYGVPADQVTRSAYSDYALFDADCSLGSTTTECLVPGYGGAAVTENGFLEESHNVTASDCRARCWSVHGCAAFSASDRAPGSCFLYSAQVESIKRYTRESYIVSNRACQDPAPAPNCARPGWGSLSDGQFGYYRSVSGISLVDCQTQCNQDISCRAFNGVTNDAKGNCYLYSVPADSVYRTDFNGYAVYDRRCSLE